MITLKSIGYWKSKDSEYWPDPARFIDENWDRMKRDKVISYLNKGDVLCVSPGLSWCRFRCKKSVGNATYADGYYEWPEGLSHYLRYHNVRLPDEFVEHALNNKPVHYEYTFGNFTIENEWWCSQKGWSEGQSFLTPDRNGELWLHTNSIKVTSDILKFIRGFQPFCDMSTKVIIDTLSSNSTVFLAEGYWYCDYIVNKEELNQTGMLLEYVEK